MQQREGSSLQYDYVIERDVSVTMADGTSLFLDIYRPALGDGAVAGQWPVLLEQRR